MKPGEIQLSNSEMVPVVGLEPTGLFTAQATNGLSLKS